MVGAIDPTNQGHAVVWAIAAIGGHVSLNDTLRQSRISLSLAISDLVVGLLDEQNMTS
jgi:hypothetical protein